MGKFLSLQKSNDVILKGIPLKMYEQVHLSVEEWVVLAPSGHKNRRTMFKVPFHECLQTDVTRFLGRGKNFKELVIKNYLLALAFLQRCRLPLEYTMNAKHFYQLPLKDMPNFIILSDLFDEHYKTWNPLIGNDTERMAEDKKAIQTLALKFWFSGYGVIKGVGHEPITNVLLKKVADKFHQKSSKDRKHKTFMLLSYLLSKEEMSSVQEPMSFSDRSNVFESESEHWSEESSAFKTELALHIKDYVFEFLKNRVDKGQLQIITDIDGNSETVHQKQITAYTWRAYSHYLRKLCVNYLYPCQVHTIKDVLEGRLMDAFVDMDHDNNISKFSRYVNLIENWFDLYVSKNKLFINKKRIIPSTNLGTRDKRYGKHIDFKQTVKFIETLQDDQTPYHEDNELQYFRCRRLSLLMLETGKRAHEVAYLKQNCLKTNVYGDSILHFHKTKTGKQHDIKISKNAVEWVKQLQSVAPTEPIEIKSEIFEGGDDIKAKRLFAGASKVTPLLPYNINSYLKRLQKRIWKGNTLPSGRYFTSHDLRRMSATYLKLKGLSNEEIAYRLGHDDLASQYTYTLTAGNDVLDSLQDVSKQGLYGIKAKVNKNSFDSNIEEVKVLSEESFFNKASMVIDVVEDEENAKSFIDKLLQEINGVDLPAEPSQPDGEIPKGFPMRTHNCNAHERVTCFHHTLKCYKCKKYSPDEDMILEHKAELVRWVVFVHHQEKLLKKTKDRVEKRTLPVRIDDIKNDLKSETFNELFRKFKHLSEKEAEAVEKEIYQTANKYIKKHYKKFPSPTAKQMEEFVKSGVING
ncbi:site-specific integrase [Peribacillus frigoritolerans]|uniref:site-specific integrase n=1 Tax=Peribacillus frigoritolerans TaxID=450367 RepID=UPI002B246EED|nr:site-specific integrase [Peribacillus frigoritolerans]MEB2494316.1 site-specific integrase [Peribacillus frigoritolerans]